MQAAWPVGFCSLILSVQREPLISVGQESTNVFYFSVSDVSFFSVSDVSWRPIRKKSYELYFRFNLWGLEHFTLHALDNSVLIYKSMEEKSVCLWVSVSHTWLSLFLSLSHTHTRLSSPVMFPYIAECIILINLAEDAFEINRGHWRWKLLSCAQLCDPVDYTVHGILQTRIVEWVAFPFSRRPSQPRDWTQVSCIAGGIFTSWATREAQEHWSW